MTTLVANAAPSLPSRQQGKQGQQKGVRFDGDAKEDRRPGPQTLVNDFVELVDAKTGRVFFYSESKQVSKWGLPLEGLGNTPDEISLLKGWCLHVDPSTQRKFFANEGKFSASWKMPDVVSRCAGNNAYLRERKSWAVQRQETHGHSAPRSSGSQGTPVAPPPTRRMTLRALVQTCKLDKVFSDTELFRAFMLFSATFHAEENVLFYCVVEAFSHRGEKSVEVLGLDDLSKSGHKGLPRTQSHLHQIALDKSRADKLGTTLERIQLVREATAIFDRFLATGAPDWVCVDQRYVEAIHNEIASAREDVKKPISRKIFNVAQRAVFKNLEHDLLPRFVKAVLTPISPEESSDFKTVSDVTTSSNTASGNFGTLGTLPRKFASDEVLRHHLMQVVKRPDGLTAMMTTANSFKSLYPSPRAVIEGRQGSGLSPAALMTHNEQDGDNDKVIAQPDPGSVGRRRPSSIRNIALRPFSGRLFGQTSDKRKESESFSSNSMAASQARRNSTGMNRATLAADKPGSKTDDEDEDFVVAAAGEQARTRARSKSDTEANNADLYPPDLDTTEFTLPGE